MVSVDTESKVQRPRSSGVVVPHKPTLAQQVGAWFVFILLQSVLATLRCRWTDRSGFFDNPPAGPAIYCFWHNRLAVCMKAHSGYIKKRNQTSGVAAMISASKDGGFLAAIVERFGVQPVRGSSSRRGPQALLELTSLAERGYDLAITPDGPRGPRYEVQDGVVALAQVTGLPIVPVSYRLDWKIQLKSWDQFQIPLPFSRCEIIFEKPVHVSRNASVEECENLRLQLEQMLKAISRDSA
jgi:lysophospholipid acyltransferase (LPLAT)-like uncharacterized protein